MRLDVWSDYVCPFCYLEEPVLTKMQEEFGDQLAVHWRAFELRPDPVPTLPPRGDYLLVFGKSFSRELDHAPRETALYEIHV